MDRIQELLSNITNLSDDELSELRDLVVQQLGMDSDATDGDDSGAGGDSPADAPAAAPAPTAGMSIEQLEELAEAATAVRNEFARREADKPKPREGGWTVITAGADLPGFAMGAEIRSQRDLAEAFSRRIDTMRGIRGGDGDKIIVASAKLQEMLTGDRHLSLNDPEGNLQRVMDVVSPKAIVAAGGLGAPEESRYELFGAGDTDRPV